MSNIEQRVKFEEVTPNNMVVAFFEVSLFELISHLNLPIYAGYNELDVMRFTFLTLPSGKTVNLAEFEYEGRIGVDLYVDYKQEKDTIPLSIYESCQLLGKPRDQVTWLHDNFQEAVDQIFAENGDIQEIEKTTGLESQQVIYNPIACFQHSLRIYDRAEFPEYWAMLQYNLGTAYYQAFTSGDGDRGQNLKLAINHYLQSEEIYTQYKFPERWKISQDTLRLVKTLFSEDFIEADLVEANLIRANLSGANLCRANLSSANLSNAEISKANFSGANLTKANFKNANLQGANLILSDLIEADLSGANLMRADLNGANLSNSIVIGTRFRYARGISGTLRKELKQRGAIFDDRPPVDSRSIISSHS
jgi:Pentapeptide repeats (8 copies)